jgi:hypothetical protein
LTRAGEAYQSIIVHPNMNAGYTDSAAATLPRALMDEREWGAAEHQ